MYVIDTSVILAYVRGEPGGDRLQGLSRRRADEHRQLAETVTKCIELGIDPEPAVNLVRESGISLVNLDADHAILAGQLRRKARKGVLSLGDRSCIATAALSGRTAVTADRIWASLDLPCPVELIR